MLRALVAVALLCIAHTGYACDSIVGWVGVPLCQAAAGTVAVPNVIGEVSSAAADTTLEAVGLDLGVVASRCSAEALNEVVAQDPSPGVVVNLGELVDVLVSNGVECVNNGRKGLSSRGISPFF